MKIEGSDDLRKSLKNLAKNSKKLEGTTKESFNQLFNDVFMAKYTNFDNIDSLFDKAEITIESEENFDTIDTTKLNAVIKSNTQFTDWDEMFNTAVDTWVESKLFEDI